MRLRDLVFTVGPLTRNGLGRSFILVIYPHSHRLQSSSFLGLPYSILNMNHKKELLWSLWVTKSYSWKS